MSPKTAKTSKATANSFPQQLLVRLDKFLKERGDTYAELAKNIYVSPGYFSSMKANGGAIGSEVLSKICLFYGDLSSEWLLTGRGEMTRSAVALKKEAIVQTKELNRKIRTVKNMLKTVSAIQGNVELLTTQAEELR